MIKIPTMFYRDESIKGHPVMNKIKPECQWVLDGEGVATEKKDGMNVKVENGILYKRRKPKDRDYDMASYVQCEITSPDDKYLFEAFGDGKWPDGIYEAIGPKIQGNPHNELAHRLVLVVPAGPLILPEIRDRSFDGLRELLLKMNFEGIVFHRGNGEMAKIKRRDFGIKWP